MKKVLSSILISLILFVNLFAPISVGLNNKKIEINKNVASATDEAFDSSVDGYKKAFPKSSITQNDSLYIDENLASVDLHIKIDTGRQEGSDPSLNWQHVQPMDNDLMQGQFYGYNEFAKENALILKIKESATGKMGWVDITSYILTEDVLNKRKDPHMFVSRGIDYIIRDKINPSGSDGLSHLSPGKSYEVTMYYQACTYIACGEAKGNGESILGLTERKDFYIIATSALINTADKAQVTTGLIGKGNVETVGGQSASMPACSLMPTTKGTVMGCISQAFYYVLFIPTSYLFALAGTFFDQVFAYSVNDTSYRSSFVVEGWGLIRDFCNLFFIFVLLYTAIGTILSLHGFHAKETIVKVVIIGLFINFSLFATQVIIDMSNITARVFYNSDAIKITDKGANGVNEATSKIDASGVIPLSAALVNKINPQNLIIHRDQITDITDKGGQSKGSQSGDENMGAGTFILIVILASAVNIIGLIVFLSVGLIFVARVVGLWVAMILSPLAFFTYILPQTSGIKMIGWKNWWPDTLKLAFLAPVFIFFMYIILKFLELDLISDPLNQKGLTFVIATVLPFAFIMILLMKAKGIAKDMSGEMGQQITGGIAAGGGAILGGAALGGAFLGRKVIGEGLARASSGNTLSQKFMDPAKRANMNWLQKTGGWIGSGGGTGKGINKVHDWTGNLLNKSQEKTNNVEKARHSSDEDMKKAGFEGLKWNQLSDEQKNIVKSKVEVENNSKFTEEAERTYRNDPINLAMDPHLNTVNPATGKLKDLTPDQKLEVKNIAKSKAVEKFEKDIKKAAEGVNTFTRVMAGANTGSYDVRKLSDIKANKNASALTKLSAGLISSTTTGIRSGILKSAGLSNGEVKVEGKFLNDLKSVIGDSLKSVKISIPKSGGGDHHEEVKVGHGH